MSYLRRAWYGRAGKELRIVWGERTFDENQRASTLLEWFNAHGEWHPDVEKRPGEGVVDVPSDPPATT